MQISHIGGIYLALILAVYLLAWRRDRQRTRSAARSGAQALLGLLPLLLAIFALVGLAQEFLPTEVIQQTLGEGNHLWALSLAGLSGAIAVGPPLASYPIAATLLNQGAWAPAVATFVLSWISVGVLTLPFEAQTLSWRFALLRNGISLLAALLSGWLIGMLL